MRSLVREVPMRRVKRVVPPAPGMIPREVSVRPRRVAEGPVEFDLKHEKISI